MPPDDSGAGAYDGRSFFRILTEAVVEMTIKGYDSAERVAYWVEKLRQAAARSLTPEHVLDAHLRATLGAVYRAKVERGGILTQHPGVSRFTLAQFAPRLRAELDRRIVAAANLIKLNRPEAIRTTLRRFAGWATSIPSGGSDAVDRVKVKESVGKPLRSLPFTERRVAIDQGHKLVANISEILAQDGGAIAGIWHSNWRQANYDFRKDHKERDGQVYLVRGSWAQERGLVKSGGVGYTDDVTRPGEEVFCRCHYSWIHSLRRMPDAMVTEKGREELERVRLL